MKKDRNGRNRWMRSCRTWIMMSASKLEVQSFVYLEKTAQRTARYPANHKLVN